MTVETIAKRHGFPPWRRRFQGIASEASLGGEHVQLLLPGTFMNESGRAVAEAVHFYKVSLPDVVVFHDELELPKGKVRVRTGGGNSGHNGLRSVSKHIGNDYRRVRLGIDRPRTKEEVHHYVLTDFPLIERAWLELLTSVVAEYSELLAKHWDAAFQGQVEHAMNSDDPLR